MSIFIKDDWFVNGKELTKVVLLGKLFLWSLEEVYAVPKVERNSSSASRVTNA